MRAWVGEEKWPLVEKHLRFYQLDSHVDGRLSVSDEEAFQRYAEAIQREEPDVVVFDPLESFAGGSLNSDSSMGQTLRDIQTLVRLGKPDCATIIVHHSRTGKAGINSATGLESSSFNRNSKVLFNKTRGQIHLVPRCPDNHNLLLLACGKNSNGPRFDPIGIRLNTETMIYEVDPTYVAPSLAEAQGAPAGPNRAITAEQVLAVVLQGPISRKQLVDRLMGVTGKAKSVVYTAIKRAEDTTICLDENDRYVPVSELGKPEADTP